jgi:hypothetical protein
MSLVETQAQTPPAQEPSSGTTEQTPPSLINGNAKTEPAPTGEPKVETAPKAEPLTAEAIQFPEGLVVDDAAKGKFLEIANEFGISKDAANKLVGLQAELAKQASEAGSKLWMDTQKQWQDQVRADQEIGGTKLEENLSHIAKLLNTHGNDEVRQAFDVTGAGNHPAVIKFLVKLGKELGEGTPVSGRPSTAPQDAASILYPNQGNR